jgi:hypothetical protein
MAQCVLVPGVVCAVSAAVANDKGAYQCSIARGKGLNPTMEVLSTSMLCAAAVHAQAVRSCRQDNLPTVGNVCLREGH